MEDIKVLYERGLELGRDYASMVQVIEYKERRFKINIKLAFDVVANVYVMKPTGGWELLGDIYDIEKYSKLISPNSDDSKKREWVLDRLSALYKYIKCVYS